jgi:hypothetical protein
MPDSTTLAVFKIDGKERDIMDFNFEFTQATDKENQPCGIPRPGKLTVKILSNKTDGNAQLLSWMLNCSKKKGEIVIKDVDGKILNTITFEDAYCVNYKLTWVEMWIDKGTLSFTNTSAKDANGNSTAGTPSMLEDIAIAWKKLTWNGITYENNWQ